MRKTTKKNPPLPNLKKKSVGSTNFMTRVKGEPLRSDSAQHAASQKNTRSPLTLEAKKGSRAGLKSMKKRGGHVKKPKTY